MDMMIDAVPNISVITQIELLCWKTDTAIEQKVKSFIRDSVILNISPDIIDYCVSLRRDIKAKTPDAIIASTALVSGFSLITSNEKDFENVKSLEIINPKKL
jgi:predicted nucleic acid-binding protein